MLIEYAQAAGLAATRALPRDEQKKLGQFMTPGPIARHMAERAVRQLTGDTIRILEPAAGAGVLAAAAVEAILAKSERPRVIELLLCEIDTRLHETLVVVAMKLQERCREHGVALDWYVRGGDFLLSETATKREPLVDLVISNPPYFKIGGKDARARAHAYAVHGQPNIYALFMAACASLLREGGQFCFITPRSWMAGSYFSAMRRHLLASVRLDAIHSFESRQQHFEDDEVLQEAVITWATARAPAGDVIVSTSTGARDLEAAKLQALPLASLVRAGHGHVVAIPSSASCSLAGYTATLSTYGLQVSTGPVVAFRQAANLREQPEAGTVPLLWMQHVRPDGVTWPISKKREHIVANAKTAWALVANSPMVLLRRFSPPEDARRITAAAYTGGLPGAVLGLENHLNYIYRPGGEMSADEVRGLAAYLTSAEVDAYIRGVVGNTQVGAAELRRLPLPPMETLIALGKDAAKEKEPTRRSA